MNQKAAASGGCSIEHLMEVLTILVSPFRMIILQRCTTMIERGVWVAEIELDANAEQIDFFSNYLSRVKHNGRSLRNISLKPVYASGPTEAIRLVPFHERTDSALLR